MADRNVRVPTTSGTVEGFAGKGVAAWRSIPYAQPPVGPLRLREQGPAIPWRGVGHCYAYAFGAPRKCGYTMVGVIKFQPMSEDCLTLNVVAPAEAGEDPLPVMFFIHGGGYMMGSSAT